MLLKARFFLTVLTIYLILLEFATVLLELNSSLSSVLPNR